MAGNKFGSGIPLASGFDFNAEAPLDHRTVKATIAERDAMNTELYVGLQVFVEETGVTYICSDLSPISWKLIGGNVKSGEGLDSSTAQDGTITIKHGSKPTNGTAANSEDVSSGVKVITEVDIDKYGHVAKVKSRTLTAELTWDRLVALFKANGFTLSNGSLTATQLRGNNLVTWNTKDTADLNLPESVEDPVDGRDPNAIVQITWSQIVALFNANGFTLNNGELIADGELHAENLITHQFN